MKLLTSVHVCVHILMYIYIWGGRDKREERAHGGERERQTESVSKGSRNPNTYPPRMRIVRAVFKHYSDSSSELRMIYF